MMQEQLNLYAAQASQLIAQLGQCKWGIVESYNPEDHTARFMIEGTILSGWLHVGSLAAGGLHFIVPPVVGTMVLVALQEGDADGFSGTIVASAFNDRFPPAKAIAALGGSPTAIEQTEMAIVQEGTGSSWRVTKAGKWVVKGDIEVDGNITSTKDVTDKLGSLDKLRQHYNGHRHTGVQSGPSQTGTTTQPDP